jgi:hypothetical protein
MVMRFLVNRYSLALAFVAWMRPLTPSRTPYKFGWPRNTISGERLLPVEEVVERVPGK